MELETVVMNIIAKAGEAKSMVYRSVDAIGSGDSAGASKLLEDAEHLLRDVHEMHYQLLTELDSSEVLSSKMILLLMHAEDIFSSTMTEKELVKSLLRNGLLGPVRAG